MTQPDPTPTTDTEWVDDLILRLFDKNDPMKYPEVKRRILAHEAEAIRKARIDELERLQIIEADNIGADILSGGKGDPLLNVTERIKMLKQLESEGKL